MEWGYARVSTPSQDAGPQLRALQEAGCERILIETASGALASRPKLDHVLVHAEPGHRITVTKLDRIGRSLEHLIQLMRTLDQRGIKFRSLAEGFDTATAQGRLLMHVVGAFAEFERELIRERTHDGLRAARAKGRTGGRPRALRRAQAREAVRMVREGRTMAEVAEIFQVSRSTISRLVADDLRKRAESDSEGR